MPEADFQKVQRQLCDHIRDPDSHAGPEGIEDRRLNIYRDLFFRTTEGLLSSGFPVLREIYSDEAWNALVRDFLRLHRCHSPYFLEVAQEFLAFLQNERDGASDPAFLLELAHYEWVETALMVAEDELPEATVLAPDAVLDTPLRKSPLAWSLGYSFPVHLIGVSFQPDEPAEQATYIVVYRNRDDEVGFMEINAVTARLLEILDSESGVSGRTALSQIAEEMQFPQPDALIDHGIQLLAQLHEADIVLA